MNKIIKNRRSVRDFNLNKKVSDSEIIKLIESSIYAPTACNLQLFKIILVDDRKKLKQLEKNVTGKVKWSNQLLVFLTDPKITFENNANYISLGMVAENLLLEAENNGISTCPISGFGNKNYIKKVLKIPKKWDVPLMVCIGYGNKNNFIPYREKVKNIFSKNKFIFKDTFPNTSNIKKWTQNQILNYRRRIFSVYYPRFRHSIFNSAINEFYIEKSKNKKNILLFFPWSKEKLDIVNNLSDNCADIGIIDILPDYLNFLKNKYKKIKKSYILGKKYNQKYDIVLASHNLMFQKDLKVVFKQIKLQTHKKSEIYISLFNKLSLTYFIFGILRLFGFNKDIYHKSFFFIIGPYGFISKNMFKKICKDNHLKIESKIKANSKILEKNIDNKVLKYIIKIINNTIKDTVIYKIKNDN